MQEESFMQKTFIKYTMVIITAAIFLIFVINSLLTFQTLENQQFKTFYAKIEQVIHTLENNQAELAIINENLDEDYLTRAKAASYVLDKQKDLSGDVSEMQYLANLLNVDELHVIDENGIIVAASVSKYVGIDMNGHPQTRAFLSILESNDENAFLIQDMQPNAAENKMMKYVGVARKGQKGVVQVGFEPIRQLEAQSRYTYEDLFSKFPTDVEEEIFVVDYSTGVMIGHSDGIDRKFAPHSYEINQLLACTKGSFQRGENGNFMYIVSRAYNNMLICATIPAEILLQKLLKSVFSTLLYLLLIEAVVILLLNYLVKRNVVDGIHRINENLSAITNGNLDTTVCVGGNPEFEKLSQGINLMVKSIVSISDRISAIIEISGMPLAAYEYKRDAKHVFVTSGLKTLLDIPDKTAAELYRNSLLFEQFMKNITDHPLEGETDIFKINEKKYVRIHMSESSGEYFGAVTDITRDVMEKKRILYENTHDTLTGLYKYKHFKYLAKELLQNMPAGKLCAIVMLDLDCFKSINDNFGHDTGDKYLQVFSSVMHAMPVEHFLTARRSGDEFCMMIFDCEEKSEIEKFLNDFYKALKSTHIALTDTESKTISASSGFVWTADSGANLSDLLKYADEALYQMKKKTKGSYAEYSA